MERDDNLYYGSNEKSHTNYLVLVFYRSELSG